MTDNTTLLPLVQKFFENDLNAAAGILESMPEEEAAGALRSLGSPGREGSASQLCRRAAQGRR